MQFHKRSKYKRNVKILNADIKAAPNTAPEIGNAEIIKAAKDNDNSSHASVHVKRKKT